MFNMFVVALVPFKSHCYFFKIYFAADTAKSKPEADLLDLISRNRDIMYGLWLGLGVRYSPLVR